MRPAAGWVIAVPGATSSPDFVADTRVQIERRIAALEPLVIEFRILRIALAAIECWMPRPDGPPRTRAEQVLEVIAWRPGATTAEIAAQIGISPPKVYPALRTLEGKGFAHRTDRRWHLGPAGFAVQALLWGEGAVGPPGP